MSKSSGSGPPDQPSYSAEYQKIKAKNQKREKMNQGFEKMALSAFALSAVSFLALPFLVESLDIRQKQAVKKTLAIGPLNNDAIEKNLKEIHHEAVVKGVAHLLNASELDKDIEAIRIAYAPRQPEENGAEHEQAIYRARLLVAKALGTHLGARGTDLDERYFEYHELQQRYLEKIVADPKNSAKLAINATSTDVPLGYRTSHHGFIKWADTVVHDALILKPVVAHV